MTTPNEIVNEMHAFYKKLRLLQRKRKLNSDLLAEYINISYLEHGGNLPASKIREIRQRFWYRYFEDVRSAVQIRKRSLTPRLQNLSRSDFLLARDIDECNQESFWALIKGEEIFKLEEAKKKTLSEE